MLTQVGKYQILEKIGVGGFGSVYRGRDPFIKRSVAIKTCQGDDDEIRKRFFREAEYAGNLHHPNITTIYDFGVTDDGIPYIVQEFLTGEDLDKKIKRQEQISILEKIRILRDVAEGLGYAHGAGIIHRDIKPSNIRILEDGSVKIMDFGIAKSMISESTLTQTGITLGTASYLAPEQIRGEPVDQRTDIFSLGVLAYELFSLQKPFTGDHISTVLYKILHEEPPHPIEAMPAVPPSLSALILSTLEKDRTRRPSSCAEIREVLYWISREVSGKPGDGSSRTERLEIDPSTGAPSPASLPIAGADSSPFPGAQKVALSRPEAVSRSGAGGSNSAAGITVGEVPIKEATLPGTIILPPPSSSGAPLRIFLSSLALLAAVAGAAWYIYSRPTPSAGRPPAARTSPPVPGPTAPPALPTPVPAARPSPAPTSAPSPTPTSPPVPRVVPAAGSAFFRPNAYVELTVDGKKRKEGIPPAGIRVGPMTAGRHRAVFSIPDFMSITRDFEVRAGETTDVTAQFPARGLLQVNVKTPEAHGAEVLVDGVVAGTLPLRKTLIAGPHKVELRHPAFEPGRQDVVVPEDDLLVVTFELRRKAPAR